MVCRTSSTPYLLITFGIIILLDNTNIVVDAWSKLWPLLLVVFGVHRLCLGMKKE